MNSALQSNLTLYKAYDRRLSTTKEIRHYMHSVVMLSVTITLLICCWVSWRHRHIQLMKRPSTSCTGYWVPGSVLKKLLTTVLKAGVP